MPTGVYKRTEKHLVCLLKNMEKAIIRASEVNRGKHLTKEHKMKISKANKGKVSSMLGKTPWNKGIPNSGFKQGYIPWNKGKKWTTEFKEKMIKIHKERLIGVVFTGRKKSEIEKENMRQKMLGKGNHFFGKRHNVKSRLKMRLSRIKNIINDIKLKGPTKIEKRVYEELEKKGFLFERQKLVNGKFLVDVYIPRLNLIIECDGGYWHSLDRVRKKDKAENAYLQKCGYKLLRLSEQEIDNGSFMQKINLN